MAVSPHKTDFSILKHDAFKAVQDAGRTLNQLLGQKDNRDNDRLNDAARALLDAHEQLDRYNETFSLLINAIGDGKLAVVQDALAQGVDPNLTSMGGFTLLSYAAAAEKEKIVDLLLAHGADPALKSGGGFSAVEQTAIKDNVRIFKKLARAGAKIDAAGLKTIARRNDAQKIIKRLGR